MKVFVALSCILTLCTAFYVVRGHDDVGITQAQNSRLSVFQPLIGEWTVSFEEAAVVFNGTVRWSWDSGKQFLVGEQKGTATYEKNKFSMSVFTVITFDDMNNKYRKWSFHSAESANGGVGGWSEDEGLWNADKRQFTFTTVNPKVNSQRTTIRIINENSYELETLVTLPDNGERRAGRMLAVRTGSVKEDAQRSPRK